MIRFSINTLGCKVNLCESDDISRELTRLGFGMVGYGDDPDFCIINTCTVTAESDRKARQLIRRIKNASKRSKIIVTGCFTGSNKKFLEDTGIDYIINNSRKDSIPGFLYGLIKNDIPTGPCTDHPINNIFRHSRPFIKIQDGCEQNCTYCIIPGVRGRYRSMGLADIIRKIDYIEVCGYEEIVLTGIHIGKYGADTEKVKSTEADPAVRDLGRLITEILSRTMIKRIRISSLEINEITAGLLEVIKNNSERIAPHLHIPLQSGSDKILGSMGRPYNRDHFIRKIKEVREVIPDAAITTDIIVGFPGETAGDFEETVLLVKKLDFSKLHVFKYSPRPGTIASKIVGQVDFRQKSERSKELRDLGDRMRDDFINKNLGRRLLVICERQDRGKNTVSGTSGEYIKVYFKTERDFGKIHGKLVQVASVKKYRGGLWAQETV
ncbi:MAG: tRNA (N(6)-L-threonylcarbamoyladenosine(37)-C(2))-methylthiotransferase MtaB [Actinobacteria bacterium]|nr:tRNA (N(6)-L-threonylcarbamoyladenosine(37)-C(2))-methylthiotransferase MtaB [Actinomycetota bacterium]